ncbi:MAG: hypothetical protein ACYC6Q_07885 [Syntrophales bacterium]
MSLKLCVQRRKLNAFAINAFRASLTPLFIHGADAINYLGKGQCLLFPGIYLCRWYSGAGLKDIGEKFGMKESAVSQASRRFAEVLERDKELADRLEKVRNVLRM